MFLTGLCRLNVWWPEKTLQMVKCLHQYAFLSVVVVREKIASKDSVHMIFTEIQGKFRKLLGGFS